MHLPSSAPGSPLYGRVLARLVVMLAVSAVLGLVVAGLAVPLAGALGLTARAVADSVDDLPQPVRIEPLPQRSVILDRDGGTVATFYEQNRSSVRLDQVSRTMVQAIVAIEDYRFYEHGALDLRGTLRALLTNVSADAVTQGGSSITQQLAKLTLLQQADTDAERKAATEESYARKLRELRLAIALEEQHPKDWILERYLNTAYFGDGAYGIQAAAQHYFGVDAADLGLRESAMLAGIVQSPDRFDPTNDPRQARLRRNVVLDRMAELGVVPERRAARATRSPLGLDVQPRTNGCTDSSAQFFCEYVVSYLAEDPALGRTPQERLDLLRRGGLRIETTLDPRMQQAADDSVRSHVHAREEAVGALALVEPGTGEVKALAQSRGLGRGPGETYLNYTVPPEHGGASGFQPGSTFKAYVLAAALEQGIGPDSVLASPARALVAENTFSTCAGPYPGSGVWDVKNLDLRSHTVTLTEATRQSINTYFAALEQRTGICAPWQLARATGIDVPPDYQVPSFALGVADVSPLDMAESYATFAARGRHCESRPVTRVRGADGRLLTHHPAACTRVLSEPVADVVNEVLAGVVGPGGFGEALHPGQQAAGKTGTTTGNMAVWFTGYTPNLAGAAVVAGVSRSGQPQSLDGLSIGGVVSYATSGSTTAGPIWGDAFKAVAPHLPDATFTPPATDEPAGG